MGINERGTIMKAILMSIKPQYVAKILNKEKTIEIRKKFPKDYVGWVYIYCTKGKTTFEKTLARYHDAKVVARFWCDKVDMFRCNITGNLKDGFFKAKPYCKVIEDGIANYNCDDEFENILKNAQLTNKELAQYLGDKECPYGDCYVFNAIHITKLEIFDKPKELSEFIVCLEKKHKCRQKFSDYSCKRCVSMNLLTCAPQSFCFIEV